MLKDKILRGEKMVGTHIYVTDVASSKMAGLAGYDYIWLDWEHSYMNFETLQNHIIAIQGTGTPVVVRVPQNDLTATKKILDMGPDGIVFPMVHSAAEANKLIDMTLYPPYGSRGFCPMNAIDFGFKDVLEYVEANHDTMCRFIQLEHADAIDDLDEIMENPFIDGYIFGPNDLSGSINDFMNVYGDNTTGLIIETTERLHAAGKYAGLSTGSVDEQVLRHWYAAGIDMISAGSDLDFIRIMLKSNLETLDKIFRKGE